MEASRLPGASFMAFSFIAVTLDMDNAILGFHNQLFGRHGASTLAPWEPFWPLGDPLGDHRSSVKDTWGSRNHIFSDLGMILGPHFESCLGSDGLNSIFVQACVRAIFCTDCLIEILTVARLKTRSSYGKYCENHVFAKVVLK